MIIASTGDAQDLEILRNLNRDYLNSDQNSDVARYEQFLAPEFTASLPDYGIYSRQEFLDMIAKPRPFTDLQADNVVIQVLDDVALVHGHITFTDLQGRAHQGRYTDEYQRRDEQWLCIGANVIAVNLDTASP